MALSGCCPRGISYPWVWAGFNDSLRMNDRSNGMLPLRWVHYKIVASILGALSVSLPLGSLALGEASCHVVGHPFIKAHMAKGPRPPRATCMSLEAPQPQSSLQLRLQPQFDNLSAASHWTSSQRHPAALCCRSYKKINVLNSFEPVYISILKSF